MGPWGSLVCASVSKHPSQSRENPQEPAAPTGHGLQNGEGLGASEADLVSRYSLQQSLVKVWLLIS